jgi:hypothetical protein
MEWRDDLHDTNQLIRHVILPKLIQLELELESLRRHTWPYIQARKEMGQLDDIAAKRDFCKHLDDNTILELLRIKAKYSKATGLQGREYDMLKNNFC